MQVDTGRPTMLARRPEGIFLIFESRPSPQTDIFLSF